MGDALDKKFDELTAKMNKTITQSIEAGMKSLDKKLDELKMETNKIIKEKFESCSRKTERVNLKVNEVEATMDNFIDNARRSCKLTLNGIQFVEGENLKEMFRILSAKLGFESPPDAIIFRFKGTDNNRRPISIKFSSEFYKNEFFQRYLKIAKQLTLEIFPAFKKKKDRIYLQPDLSTEQYQINKSAVKLMKAGKIKMVRILDGNVMIKLTEADKLTRFLSAEALEIEIKNREKDDGNKKRS